MSATADEKLLTPKEAMEYLGVGKTWLWDKTRKGEIPHRRLGARGPVRYSRAELDAWSATNR